MLDVRSRRWRRMADKAFTLTLCTYAIEVCSILRGYPSPLVWNRLNYSNLRIDIIMEVRTIEVSGKSKFEMCEILRLSY